MFTLSLERIRELGELDWALLTTSWTYIDTNEFSYYLVRENNKVKGYIKREDLLKLRDYPHDNMQNAVILIDHACIINQVINITSLFQLLGERIAFIVDADHEFIGYIKREDFFLELLKQEDKYVDILKVIFTSIPLGLFVFDCHHRIVNYNDAGLKMIRKKVEDIGQLSSSFFNQHLLDRVINSGKPILNELIIGDESSVLVDYTPILDESKQVEGILIVVQDLPKVEEMAMEIEHIKHLNRDLQAILSSIYDGIIVVDKKGILVRYSDSVEENLEGMTLKSLLGKNILSQDFYLGTLINQVISQQCKISTVHEFHTKKKILIVGNPIFLDNGELDRIIIALRDVTEATQLKTELKEMKELSEKYKQELDSYKIQNRVSERFIYASKEMDIIVNQIRKMAEFSSTILLYGESGVGKEVIAQTIHELGNRKDGPFLTINCGAIPENLLESELFGYIKGAFTGAEKGGKVGYFVKANKGILFLDEIGELPIHLQVKLLRVLQQQEVTPIGSTEPIKIDIQIVAATNKRLEEMVKEGTFRQDLYYRLNVIPIIIPPLRERLEDIPLLAVHFLKVFNEKYKRKYHFTPDALQVFEWYHWPGNVRELQNMVERLVVSSDNEEIDGQYISGFLTIKTDFTHRKGLKKIVPLRDALEEVEEQLILMAMSHYGTTTKAAKALGISQSSVSRKYQRIIDKQPNYAK